MQTNEITFSQMVGMCETDYLYSLELSDAIDKLHSNGLPLDLTQLSRELAMSLGCDDDEPQTIKRLTELLFRHATLNGHHKNLWKRMVNLIIRERREEAKTKLVEYGWTL
jgi:hypothetical protein